MLVTDVEIYEKPSCPYCRKAKALLLAKGARVSIMDVSNDVAKHREMIRRSGGRQTVPQIFVGGRHIGGCDDLYDLDRQGKLDTFLASPR